MPLPKFQLPKLPGQTEPIKLWPPTLPSSPFKAVTILESRKIPTPFGSIETPRIELPPLKIPKLEERHRKALGHAIGIDLADIVGVVPYVGGLVADNLRRSHTEEIRKLLKPEEFNMYAKWDRTYPDVIAILRSRLGGK